MTEIDDPLKKARGWNHDRVSMMLLSGLLFARLASGVALMPVFDRPIFQIAVVLLYEFSTYLLTALLIFWERERLAEFRIGRLAVLIFLASAPYQLILVFSGLSGMSRVSPLLNLPAAVWLAVMLARSPAWRNSLRAGTPPGSAPLSLRWLGIACLVGIGAGVFSGWLISFQQEQRLNTFSLFQLGLLPTIQLARAAVQEEPLFRGFLWGWLEKKGWRAVWIWLFQATLFWFGHLYYLGVSPYSWWIVPIMGLVFGWLSWRARDIAPGMFAHGLTNGIAQIVSGN